MGWTNNKIIIHNKWADRWDEAIYMQVGGVATSLDGSVRAECYLKASTALV